MVPKPSVILVGFFEKAYPCLFPYGEGGIERRQRVQVDFGDHIQWLLRYYDRRFHQHETFPFVCFGILQQRQALGSARVQMQRQTFQRDARLLSTIYQQPRHSPTSSTFVFYSRMGHRHRSKPQACGLLSIPAISTIQLHRFLQENASTWIILSVC